MPRKICAKWLVILLKGKNIKLFVFYKYIFCNYSEEGKAPNQPLTIKHVAFKYGRECSVCALEASTNAIYAFTKCGHAFNLCLECVEKNTNCILQCGVESNPKLKIYLQVQE